MNNATPNPFGIADPYLVLATDQGGFYWPLNALPAIIPALNPEGSAIGSFLAWSGKPQPLPLPFPSSQVAAWIREILHRHAAVSAVAQGAAMAGKIGNIRNN